MARDKVLVYAPEIRVLIATDEGVIDVSDDIVNGQLRRVMNGVSQFSCILNNRNKKYMNGVLQRMNRITVEMKRIGGFIQVFAGYLDLVPGIGLYTNTCQIQASCTLKIIQNKYWDTGFPESQELLNQLKYIGDDGEKLDSGMGKMIETILFEVGGWKKDMIHIQKIPTQFLNIVFELAKIQQGSDVEIDALRKMLGLPSFGSFINSEASKTEPVVVLPKKGETYTVADVVTVVRAAGFTGDALTTAAAIAFAASVGDPSLVKPDLIDAVTGGNNVYVGLYQFSLKANPKITRKQALDPLAAAKFFFELTKEGKDFTQIKQFKDTTYKKYLEEAKAASLKADTGAITYKSTTEIQKDASKDAANYADSGDFLDIGGKGNPTTDPSKPEASTPGTNMITVPKFDNSTSEEWLAKTFGGSDAEVKANCVTIDFFDQKILVHKLAENAFRGAIGEITTFENSRPAGQAKYTIKQIAAQGWRNKVSGNGVSMHSYGTTIDINWDQNGMPSAGVGPDSTDLPPEWIAAFKKYGFEWGGDWSNKDYMHFQWMGGDTTISTQPGSLYGDQMGLTNGAVGGASIFEQGVFRYLYLGKNLDGLSQLFTGERASINDVSVLSTMQAIITASLRSFMSGPDGSFIAFYPDYFGLSGTSAKMYIEDIELIDFKIDINDNALATDVFVIGASARPLAGDNTPAIPGVDWLYTEGIATIRQPDVMGLLLGQDSKQIEFSPESIYGRFGLRPFKTEFPEVSSPIMERLQAIMLFQRKWAEQYQTTVQFTFMPELMPGMRIIVKSHGVSVFVEEVIHTFGYDTGFNTQATISSPANIGGGIEGMPLGRV